MATNTARDPGRFLRLPVTSGYVSGDPDVVGDGVLAVVLQTDADAGDEATCDTAGAHRFAVEASAGAITPGDLVYKAEYLGLPVLSNDNGGDRFGYALESVANLATTTIEVKVGY